MLRETERVEDAFVEVDVTGDAALERAEVVGHAAERPSELIGLLAGGVAALALGLGVGADHGESGPPFVVESVGGDLREGRGDVAARAVPEFDGRVVDRARVEEPVVGVLVTAVTVGRCAVEDPRALLGGGLVANVAVDVEVAAGQGEVGPLMLLDGEGVGLELV